MIAASYFEQVESAHSPSDLFPDPDSARSTYRRLARIFHPDQNPGDSRASDAFAHLSTLWAQFNGHDTTPHSAAIVYTTKRRDYVLGDKLDHGDIANIYRLTYQTDDSTADAVLKMPRNPKFNEMIVNEVEALKTLNTAVDERYRRLHPTTIDSFSHRDVATGKTRRALVTNYLDGFVSLRDVQRAYPKGIHPRHVAWIGRRIWVAMDTAHLAGRIHTAIFPENVMIHPEDHNLVLIDWAYSRPRDTKLENVVSQYYKNGWYGARYDKPLDHRLDVRQAASTLELMLGEQEARPFRAFFNGCRVASTPTAGELYEEFESLLTSVYGKRKYVKFEMPQGWKKVPN